MVTCRDCCRCPPNNALPLAHSPFTFLITNCLDEANWDLIVWQPRLLVSLQAIFLRFHAVCSSNRFSTKLYAPAVDTTAHFSLLCSHHHHSLWWGSHLIASKRIFSLLRSFRSFFFACSVALGLVGCNLGRSCILECCACWQTIAALLSKRGHQLRRVQWRTQRLAER